MRSLATALLLVILPLLGSCRSTRPLPPDPAPDAERRYDDSVPSWVGDPLSWDKLAEVEAWLDGRAAYASDFWRLEGVLELAQGRLEFALRDRDKLGAERLASRVELARRGFVQVAADPTASFDQERRARSGIDASGRLVGSPRSAARAPAQSSAPLGTAVVARAQWRADRARPERLTAATGRWTRITVHHSAEASGSDLDGSMGSSAEAIRRIQHHAMSERSFGDIGYHFLIDPEGRVFEGRSMAWQGAHAAGDNNIENIGVCLLGNFETSRPTPESLDALARTLDHLSRAYGIPKSRIYPHQELKNTLCPGRELTRWLKSWR